MKKLFALTMAIVMVVAVLGVPASAEDGFQDLVKLLMSSENVEITDISWDARVKMEDLDACVENLEPEQIPEGCAVKSGRLTVLQQKNIACTDYGVYDVYDATFKVWSTLYTTVCLFFRAEGTDSWELLACNQGDVIEARFSQSGSYVIAMTW